MSEFETIEYGADEFASSESLSVYEPALVVGYFGQNFNINPWTESLWSWEISAAVLGLLATIQFAYFKTKRWF